MSNRRRRPRDLRRPRGESSPLPLDERKRRRCRPRRVRSGCGTDGEAGGCADVFPARHPRFVAISGVQESERKERLLGTCAFIKPDGSRCGLGAMRGYEWCYGHRPDLAGERRRNARRGGRAGGRGRPRGREELDLVQETLGAVTAALIRGGRLEDGREAPFDRRDAQVIVAASRARIQLVEARHRLEDLAEMERRLQELEEQSGLQGGGSRRALR